MTVIIDYHTGNIGSIKNMLDRLGYPSVISNKPSEIESANHIILPGVGSFDSGMTKLKELNLTELLNKKVCNDHTPILGICLGAQLMCSSSEEGFLPGLGWVDGSVKRFPDSWSEKKLIVPHMGWDYVRPLRESKLFYSIDKPRFYFAQSYYIECHDPSIILAENSHGLIFHSVFEKNNTVGVQFHPEKSHIFGKLLLKNFIENY